MREHDVGEVDWLLTDRRDIDDPGCSSRLQERQEEARQQEAGEIIHGEAQFMTILARLPSGATPANANAGIVDEDVETAVITPHSFGEAAHLGQGGEIGWIKCPGPACIPYLGKQALGSRVIATVNQNRCTDLRQPLGYAPPDAIGRARDEYRFASRRHSITRSQTAMAAPCVLLRRPNSFGVILVLLLL